MVGAAVVRVGVWGVSELLEVVVVVGVPGMDIGTPDVLVGVPGVGGPDAPLVAVCVACKLMGGGRWPCDGVGGGGIEVFSCVSGCRLQVQKFLAALGKELFPKANSPLPYIVSTPRYNLCFNTCICANPPLPSFCQWT